MTKSGFSQVDESNEPFGTRNTDGALHVVLTSDGQNSFTGENISGKRSLHTVPGHDDVYSVNVLMNTIAATTGALLIDLTNVNTWKHTETGHVDLKYTLVDLNPSSAFRGTVLIGMLTSVTSANGGLTAIEQYRFAQGTGKITQFNDYCGGLEASDDRHFGPTTASITGFGTANPVYGPDGIQQHFTADGDVAVYITAIAGLIDVSVTMGYKTYD